MKTVSPFRFLSAAEVLEARIAPASLSFVDVDGDNVTITTNHGSDAQLQAAAHLSEVTPGHFQLQELKLNGVVAFRGTNLTIDATANGGDGFVNVGYINATDLDLGRVAVSGDLGRIDVGDHFFSTPALNQLELKSMGTLNATTQAAGGTLLSTIKGSTGSLAVHGDILEAQLEISGTLGRCNIDGSIIGGADEKSGSIRAAGDFKNVTIGGMLRGGGGFDSGRISAGNTLSDVTITGGIIGGDGENSGQVGARRELAHVTVSGNIVGGAGLESGGLATSRKAVDVTINADIRGGSGMQSGEVASSGSIAQITLNGSLIGGGGVQSGSFGTDKGMSAIHITGNVLGGPGPSSGQVVSKSFIHGLTLDGSLIGGANFETGSLGSLTGVNNITIGGDIVAGTGERSGLLVCDALPTASIGSVKVLGSIQGTPDVGVAGANSGGILSGHVIDSVEISGDILGGNSPDAGGVRARDALKQVIIHGNLVGGTAENSGSIHSVFKLGTVTIDHDLKGGAGFGSGAVLSDTTIASVTIHGSMIGGSGDASGRVETDGDGAAGNMAKVVIDGGLRGGGGIDSGLVFSSGALTSIKVGSLEGGTARGSGSIAAAGNIGSIDVDADIIGGAADESGKISAGSDIKKLTITGSLIGGSGNYDTTRKDTAELGQIYAVGTIGKLSVTSIVGQSGAFSAQIRAGAIDETAVNGSVLGGAGDGSGAIIAEQTDLGVVVIAGDLKSGGGLLSGHVGAARKISSLTLDRAEGDAVNRALITAGGMPAPKNSGEAVAIKNLTINDLTTFASILAGYDVDRNAVNADAQIGAVVVGVGSKPGDWTATDLVAGAVAGSDGLFGTADDARITAGEVPSGIVSEIARVTIKGQVMPSSGQQIPTHYGIVAEHIVAVSLGGAAVPLQSGANNDSVDIGTGADTTVREFGPLT